MPWPWRAGVASRGSVPPPPSARGAYYHTTAACPFSSTLRPIDDGPLVGPDG
jgi:hypothetical protein